jgi:hypothetical protein
VLGTVKGFGVQDKSLHRRFKIPDTQTLNNALTVVGIFHAFVGYAIRQLMDRVATQLRTRAFLDKSASTAQLLNSLPGSPDWRVLFKSRIARIIRYVGLASGFLSIAGGVLYKQGIVLSETHVKNTTTYPHVFVTNCTANFSVCNYSRYFAYGFSIHQAAMGGRFSIGVEHPENSDRYTLAFVSAPLVPEVTSPVKIRAKTFAMVSEYQSAIFAELPKENISSKGLHNSHMKLTLSFHGHGDVDWSFSVSNLSDHSTRSVRGITHYCVAECEWRAKKGFLVLHSYNTTNCTRSNLGPWGNVSAEGIAHALFSDITDWQSENILDLAYVVPAMYATIILGRWEGLWRPLKKITWANYSLSDTLHCAQTWTVPAVEWNKHFVAYIIFLVLIFTALWISGFVDTKVFVSEWAPLWFGLLPDSEQENVRKQIRNNLGLESVEEIGSKYTLLISKDFEETEDSAS